MCTNIALQAIVSGSAVQVYLDQGGFIVVCDLSLQFVNELVEHAFQFPFALIENDIFTPLLVIAPFTLFGRDVLIVPLPIPVGQLDRGF